MPRRRTAGQGAKRGTRSLCAPFPLTTPPPPALNPGLLGRPLESPLIDQELYERGKALFLEAVALPRERWDGFLDAACEGDKELRRQLVDLLAHHDESAGLLDAPPWHEPPPEVPEVFGPYHVLGLLGQGSMGVVYRARLQAEGSSAPPPVVALKVLRPGAMSHFLHSRFRREIEALRRLDHPGIARLLEAGTVETTGGPRPYFAMEHIEGVTLAQWRRSTNPPERERVRLLADLCDAVHCAHQHGVVHRDLKPQNILVTPDGRPKVLDFGIARLTDADAARTVATQTWQLLGTVRYMSPEQATGGPTEIDHRSDIYALGVIAYELLTGQIPYDLRRLSTPRALLEIATVEPRALGEHSATLHGDVETIIHKALRKRPQDRYASAADLAADLRRQLEGRPISVRLPGPLARGMRVLRARPRLRRATYVIGIAVVATALTVAAMLARERRSGDVDAAFSRVYSILEEGDRLRHDGEATHEKLTAAIAQFRVARTALGRLPPRPYTQEIKCYIYWRLGELYFFLGQREHDAELLEQARGFWRDASGARTVEPLGALLPPEVAIRSGVLRLGLHHPTHGMGLAFAALAGYRAPASNLRLAVSAQRQAAGRHGDPRAYDDSNGPPEAERRADLAYVLLNEGDALTTLGATVDSLAPIERGIATLRVVLVGGAIRDAEGRSYLDHALGNGHARRAELFAVARDTAAARASLDSARVWLDATLDLRRQSAGRSYWRLRCDRAHMWEIAAGLAPDEPTHRAYLRRALDELEASRDALRADTDDFESALTQAEAASVHAEMGRLDGDAATFVRADSLLTSAFAVLTRGRFPVQYAQTQWRRGRVERLRAEITGDAAATATAAAALNRAREALPRVEWPALQRRVDAEEALRSRLD